MQETLTHASRKAVVASLGGRYFGMDRDRRWDRTKLWYDAMVHGIGPQGEDPVAAIRAAYDRGESDEFVKPVVIAGTASRSRRCATATASSSSTTARTGCDRSCAR